MQIKYFFIFNWFPFLIISVFLWKITTLKFYFGRFTMNILIFAIASINWTKRAQTKYPTFKVKNGHKEKILFKIFIFWKYAKKNISTGNFNIYIKSFFCPLWTVLSFGQLNLNQKEYKLFNNFRRDCLLWLNYDGVGVLLTQYSVV